MPATNQEMLKQANLLVSERPIVELYYRSAATGLTFTLGGMLLSWFTLTHYMIKELTGKVNGGMAEFCSS